MKLLFEPPPIFFMHIPKTGGTSVRQILRRAYAGRQIAVLEVPHLSRYTAADLPGFRCYCSQCSPSILNLIDRSDLLTMTMLRDPVERTISALYFHQDNLTRHPDWFEPEHLEQQQRFVGADLAALIADPELAAAVKDVQTRLLGSERDYRVFLADGAIGRTGRPVRPPDHVPIIGAALDEAQLFRRACQRLDNMAVVGLTERFDESMNLLCSHLGIPRPDRLPTERVGVRKDGVAIRGYRASVPAELIEQVESLTRYDQALYTYAQELFAQQWARQQARPQRTYSIAAHLRPILRTVKASVKRFGRMRP
jgi:hypothetical protein